MENRDIIKYNKRDSIISLDLEPIILKFSTQDPAYWSKNKQELLTILKQLELIKKCLTRT